MSRTRNVGAAVLFLACSGLARADTITLSGGGTIRGQILEDKSSDRAVVVRLQAGGGEVTIERSKIQAITPEKNPAAEYDAIKDQYADTAEDQYELAMWCETHKLSRQRREHLLRVLELDAEHVKAHQKLGYVLRDGKWLTRDELKEARGMVRFGGRYVTPQEKEILEQKKREDEAVREWHVRVKLWKTWLVGNDAGKTRQAQDSLLAIEDPQALEAVVGQFGKENAESLRVLLCDVLGNLPGEAATLELVKRSIIDVSPTVRWEAVDKLVERQDPAAVRTLTKALASEHNVVIRRAAEALGAIGDPSTVLPLIAALVTKHKQVITREVQGGGFGVASTPEVVDYEAVVAPGTVAFRPIISYRASGAGISMPSKEVVTVPVENREVLEALEGITKQDFGYDQATWRRWYATEIRKVEVRKRRQLDVP